MVGVFETNIEPTELNSDLFFSGELGHQSLIDEMVRYLLTKTVDIKGYTKHYLGVILDIEHGFANSVGYDVFLKMSVLEKLCIYKKMKREYAAKYKASGVSSVDFARVFGFDIRSCGDLYDSIPTAEVFSARALRRVGFDGWEFPFAFARHFIIFGQSRTGKSVTLMKCGKICLDNGWVVVDINDSNGRMETGATVFSLFDEKFMNILKTRWREARIDSRANALRMVNDVEKLREVVLRYSDIEDLVGAKVIYYHPLVEGIPAEVPVSDSFKIEFFVFSVSDLFDMLDNSNFRVIFSVFGEELTDTELGSLSHIRRFLESEGKMDTVSLGEIVSILSDLHQSGDTITVPFVDGVTRTIDFSDKSVKGLIRKLDRVNDSGLFKPVKIIVDGKLVGNPDLFDVKKIVGRKGVFNCLSTKWAAPDLKYVVISFFIDRLMEMKRRSEIKENVALLCRELYELAPPQPKGLESLTFDSLKRVCAGGADIGIRVIADSQQVMQVSREVKRNMHGFVIHKVVDKSDKDDLRASLSRHYLPREYRDLFSELGIGEAIVVYGNTAVIVRIVPVHFMSKIEGTDTFSFLKVYCDKKILTKSLFDSDRYGVIGVGDTFKSVKSDFVYPRLLKKIGVTIDDDRTLKVLTAISMVCRKEQYATANDVLGCYGLIFDREVITIDDIVRVFEDSKVKKFGKILLIDKIDGETVYSLNIDYFGYKDLKLLATELFAELGVGFSKDISGFL